MEAYLFSGFLDWGLIRRGRGLLEAGDLLNFCVFQWKYKKKDLLINPCYIQNRTVNEIQYPEDRAPKEKKKNCCT